MARARRTTAAEAEPVAQTMRATTVERRAKVVLFCCPKGGVGKTSSAKNAAVAAVREGRRVCTIDLDRQRTLSQWVALRRDQEVPQFDHAEGRLDDLDAVLGRVDPNAYDLVIIDTPPSVEEHPEAVKRLILLADLVIVPSGATVFDRRSAVPWMKLLRTYGKPAAFVLNRVKRRVTSLREAKSALIREGRLCPVEVPDLEDMHRVDEIGYSVLDVPGAAGAGECADLWHFIRNELGL